MLNAGGIVEASLSDEETDPDEPQQAMQWRMLSWLGVLAKNNIA